MLTERFYAWEDARKLAVNDPEVDLSGEGPAFTPSDELFEDEYVAEEGQEKAATDAVVADIPQQSASQQPKA